MKRLAFYLLALVVFGGGLWFALSRGADLLAPLNAESGTAADAAKGGSHAAVEPSASLFDSIRAHLQDPLSRLFIQLILIVAFARLCGAVATKCGQPAVIGEIVAGLMLGPSLVGLLWPEFLAAAFPASSLGSLRLFSQVGVCLFMFVVGIDLDVAHLRHQARTAVLVSQVSIIFPFLLGVFLALPLYSEFAGPKASFHVFALFLGIAMSITAFPVLARILEERRLTHTPLGGTALVCAATDDVTAWSLLAVVAAMAQAHSVAGAVFSIGLVVLFVAVMLLWIKPRLPRWIARVDFDGASGGRTFLAATMIFVCASALATDLMGIHAIFGAFLAGVVMPRQGPLRNFLKLRLEQFSSVFLLPVFFAFTGLRTQLGLLAEPSDWLICGAIIFLATLGKLGGAMFTARFTGATWSDSFSLGALMNTRGLVELVALNIGYDLGIISPRIFAMLVIMALVTTAMTGPLLTLVEARRLKKSATACPA
ncbi:MAG: cation:proton antiporter [Pyrinomonadaceae bacterium]|nr:cation:proton antiporter [Phycisphaerales bacterium]